MVISISIVVVLLFAASQDKGRKNNFKRSIKTYVVSLSQSRDLGYNSYYIAGLTDSSIFLGNYVATAIITQLNLALKDKPSFSMYQASGMDSITWKKTSIQVDSPAIYLCDGFTPAFFAGGFVPGPNKKLRYNRNRFSAAIVLHPGSYIVRMFDTSTMQYQLAKYEDDSLRIDHKSALLEAQADGVFSLDGKLSYDQQSRKILYTYFYRNQFLVMDTALNLHVKAHTIDTVSHATIQVAVINSEGKMTRAAPPEFVNRQSCISGNQVFIRSALKADNETKHQFDNSSVIDVYKTTDGAYQFSFYLPDINHKKIDDFRVRENELVAIYDQYIVVYQLNL